VSAKRGGGSKELVGHIRTDPFVDLAFVLPLISEERFSVIKRQAEIYNATGDIGEGTATFRMYKKEVKEFVAETFQEVYPRSVKDLRSEELVDKKATRAWRALVTLLASQQLMERARAGLGELFPKRYGDLRTCLPVIESMVKEKARSKNRRATEIVKRISKSLDAGAFYDVAPLLWWLNLVMESEVFEALFKYHFIASKRELVEGFVKVAEETLLRIRGHKADFEYMKSEALRALVSRCAELRGQYINKLQNAVVFVKLLRRGVKNPDRWGWFLQDDVLTYAMSVYITELQELSGLEGRELELDITTLLTPRAGAYGGPASALCTLILMSPIFMQYGLEARGEIAVTPADIVIGALRIFRASKSGEKDLIIGVRDLVKEIVRFWEEKDILRRLKLYSRDEATPEALCSKSSFTSSLSLIINAGIGGISITTEKRPELRLPPRMAGFDSLYIRAQQLLLIMQKVWGWEKL
jgi:hypothetical protein